MNRKYMNTAELSARDDVARKIREFRKEKNMTIDELANASELSNTHLCEIFSKDGDKIPSFRSMIRIFDALGLKEITIKWR